MLIAALLIVELAASAVVIAAVLRPTSFVSGVVSVYVVGSIEAVALTTALSPPRLVTRAGLGVSETAILVGVLGLWMFRGRPGFPCPSIRPLFHSIGRDPAVLLLAAVVSVSSIYELLLVFTVPPNNWDSLTYHLTRAAAWAQHRGVYWIPNAPTDRVNEFQPLAEQQVLLFLVATGRAALFAAPQWLAGAAIVGSIYEVARKLGRSPRAAVFAALLFATAPLFALETTTAQNDLVAAALPIAASALVLGGTGSGAALAGVAVALGIGVKLTTVLVLPIPFALALLRGRRTFVRMAVWSITGFVLLGMWSFVLNVSHTGRVLGNGAGRLAQQASPSLTGTPTTLFRILYGLFDLSGFDAVLLTTSAVVGCVLAVVAFVISRRSGASRSSTAAMVCAAALPFLAPRFIPVLAHGLHIAGNAVSLPVTAQASTGGAFFWGIDYGVNEDLSSFGALVGPLLLVASVVGIIQGLRGRVGRRMLVLAAALPLFVVLLALESKYNPWLSRFLLVPAVLTAPLLACLARWRVAAGAVAVVAVAQLALVHVRNDMKPLRGHLAPPWQLTQSEAVQLTFQPAAGKAITALDRAASRCVGAVLGPDEPSFLLFGDRLERRVVFLPSVGTARAAERAGTSEVVVGHVPRVRGALEKAGWTLRPLGTYWSLAVSPLSDKVGCARAT